MSCLLLDVLMSDFFSSLQPAAEEMLKIRAGKVRTNIVCVCVRYKSHSRKICNSYRTTGKKRDSNLNCGQVWLTLIGRFGSWRRNSRPSETDLLDNDPSKDWTLIQTKLRRVSLGFPQTVEYTLAALWWVFVGCRGLLVVNNKRLTKSDATKQSC